MNIKYKGKDVSENEDIVTFLASTLPNDIRNFEKKLELYSKDKPIYAELKIELFNRIFGGKLTENSEEGKKIRKYAIEQLGMKIELQGDETTEGNSTSGDSTKKDYVILQLSKHTIVLLVLLVVGILLGIGIGHFIQNTNKDKTGQTLNTSSNNLSQKNVIPQKDTAKKVVFDTIIVTKIKIDQKSKVNFLVLKGHNYFRFFYPSFIDDKDKNEINKNATEKYKDKQQIFDKANTRVKLKITDPSLVNDNSLNVIVKIDGGNVVYCQVINVKDPKKYLLYYEDGKKRTKDALVDEFSKLEDLDLINLKKRWEYFSKLPIKEVTIAK